MYLKKIEIQGFKSFPDKTEIKFKNNITAIVGPNGSGKSNISDAIRWVLGEQSVKNLRGSKMEDIIFSGTRKRKALSFAEVSIYFDNIDGSIPLDYDEVAVTRRVFRSGESEYYINKSACRLKDIRSIFMDTGIGKDGYSIIGQGRIDEILSNKPEERRSIFEEAAGIIKYKTKKEESERKLENTEDNLIRIDDLISEISTNNKKLEKESKKANKFISDFENLKVLEANIYTRDIRYIDKQVKKLEKDNEEIRIEITKNEIEKKNKEDIFEVLKKEMDDKEKNIEILRERKDEFSKSKDEFKNKISLLAEREKFNSKDFERLNNELEAMNHENLKLDEEILLLEKKKKYSRKEYQRLIREEVKENNELDIVKNKISSLEKEIDRENKKINSLYLEIADKKGRLDNLDFSSGNVEKEQSELKEEKTQLYKNIELLNYDLKEIDDNILNSNIKQKKLVGDKSVLEKQSKDLEGDIDKNLKEIRKAEIELGKINSDYRLYENMQNTYEGYFKSVKNLLMAIKNKTIQSKGYHGIVADLIKVEKKYETAINIALGGNLQNIVVDNEDNAKFMIDHLKTNKLGRVTFLPISTIKANPNRIDIDSFEGKGILGLANELIQYDKEYKNIFESLLARTLIIEDIDRASSFAKKTNYRYRIVTLEGELLNPGGSLSGGSYRSNISIINRKNKINEIKSNLDTCKVEFKRLKEYNESLNKELKLIKVKLDEIKKDIETNNSKNSNFKNEKTSLENKKEFTIRNIEKIKMQIESIVKIREEKLKTSTEDKEFLRINTEKVNQIEKNKELKTENLIFEKRNIEKLTSQISNLQIEKNISQREILDLEDKIKNNLRQKEDYKKLKVKKMTDIESIKKIIKDILKEKELSKNNILVKENKELEIKDKIKEAIESKDIQMNKFYREQDNLKITNETINKLEKAINNNELSISKFKLKKDNIIDKLLEDYKLDLDQAYLLEKPIDNIENSRKEIKRLKENIKKLGSINLNSIEEYKKVNERLEFMETQREDLIGSKENLKDIIKDMEKVMRVNFLKSFTEINKHFGEVFTELFDGGEATLELDYEDEDILSTGIEIKAKPPGKVLQNLSLLSGGEKSLVAVALLFAILRTKPAPFSILDEIDASLDDANIGKYTSYLKKINKDTQFILITHRKTSMEIANVLYGVTMEEEGVSRIISMELKDDKNKLVS